MADHDVLVFLLALATLLGSARLLGELARAAGMPLVVGEIAAASSSDRPSWGESRRARGRGCSRSAPPSR
jgi:hypothetical protein